MKVNANDYFVITVALRVQKICLMCNISFSWRVPGQLQDNVLEAARFYTCLEQVFATKYLALGCRAQTG